MEFESITVKASVIDMRFSDMALDKYGTLKA
jgi:hypothetical protein